MPTRRPERWLPGIDAARCTGCGWCVAACPLHLLSLEQNGWTKSSVIADIDTCTGCRKCELKCPFKVITMVRRTHARVAENGLCAGQPCTGAPVTRNCPPATW